MNKTVILTIAILTGLLILGFNFDEVFSAEPAPSGPVPLPYPVATKAIPSWVDNNFRWYVDGQIDEATLLTSMNWMFDNNVMHLSDKAAQEVAKLREENTQLRNALQECQQMCENTEDSFSAGAGFKDGASFSAKAGTGMSAGAGISAKAGATTSAGISASAKAGDSTSGVGMSAKAGFSASDSQDVQVMRVKVGDSWHHFMMATTTGDIPVDINALVQSVLRESYMEQNKDLQFHADKVQHFNDVKEAIRDSITTARERFSDSMKASPGTDDAQTTQSVPTIQKIPSRTLAPATDVSSLPTSSLEQYVQSLDEINVEMATQNTMFLSMQQVEEELTDLALKIQENNDARADLRQIIAELRNLAADPDSEYPVSLTYPLNGKTETTTVNNAEEALALADKLESQLTILSDDSQMMQMELQDMMQKQQQAMQILSAIMKTQHDTLKAIINNMR